MTVSTPEASIRLHPYTGYYRHRAWGHSLAQNPKKGEYGVNKK